MDGNNELPSPNSRQEFEVRLLQACVREIRSIITEMHHAVIEQVESRDRIVRVSRKLQAVMVRLAESPSKQGIFQTKASAIEVVAAPEENSLEAPSQRRTLPVIFLN
jgi:hypothetical protein